MPSSMRPARAAAAATSGSTATPDQACVVTATFSGPGSRLEFVGVATAWRRRGVLVADPWTVDGVEQVGRVADGARQARIQRPVRTALLPRRVRTGCDPGSV